MHFKDKLNLLLSRKGLNQAEFAAAIGVSRQAVQVWASGRSEPKGTNLAKVAEFFGVAPDWFSEEATLDSTGSPVREFAPGEEEPPEGYIAIPEYQLEIGASGNLDGGEPSWSAVNDSETAWYRVDELRARGIDPSMCKRAPAHGDSMEPLIFDGDMILWEENRDPAPGLCRIIDGQIYVIGVEHGLRVKKLARIKDGIKVISVNPSYPPEDYKGEDADNMRIYGRVVEVTHKF